MTNTQPSQAVALYVPSMVVGTTPDDVFAELRRRCLAGQIHSTGDRARLITDGPHAGSWGIPVYMIRRDALPTRSPWVRRRRIGYGVLGSLVVLAGLGWWVASTLTATALFFLLVTVLLTFATASWKATRPRHFSGTFSGTMS